MNCGAAASGKQILCPSRDFMFSNSQGQTRTSSLGPHVRFRRVQTLVREGSPLVKLRNA